MNASDFEKLEGGPYGLRWSYTYDGDDYPPAVEEVEKILGVQLSPETIDASSEREDGFCETVYFAAEEYDANTAATYGVGNPGPGVGIADYRPVQKRPSS